MNSPTSQSKTDSRGVSSEIRLEVMFQNRSEGLTHEEADKLRQYLEGVETRTSKGSPSPKLKYRVRLDVQGQQQIYYFDPEGSLLLAKSPPKKAAQIQEWIAKIASRISEEE